METREREASSRVESGGLAREIRLGVTILLVLAAIGALVKLHEFGQTRRFTIDEYQYAHATWLVAQGQRPYVDFYEHHFPLSYVLHAPVLSDEVDFRTNVLRLRTLPFAYLVALGLVFAVCTFALRRDRNEAVLASFFPLLFGFSLMCEIEYRADNFGAVPLLAALALLETNRERGRPALALACGLLVGVALFMTQKIVYVAGGTFTLLLAFDGVRRRLGAAGTLPFVARPLWFLGGVGTVVLAMGAVGAALGLLQDGFEITIVQAFEHEASYSARVGDLGRYVGPFFAATAPSTVVIGALAIAFLWLDRGRFWLVPSAVALVSGAAVAGKYPYNYVLHGLLIGLFAVRGFALLMDRFVPPGRIPAAAHAALPLLLLASLPQQLAFVERATTNVDQLHVLDKIERFSSPEDVVIDGAGGALFRPHASYYWYHGDFHRARFHAYFSGPLIDDYRDSRALFWIKDFRLRRLPPSVFDYFERHYVPVDGSLFGLGFALPATETAPVEVELDVIRAGSWNVLRRDDAPPSVAAGQGGLRIAGRTLREGAVELGEGRHRVVLEPNGPGYVLTPLPRDAFAATARGDLTHSPLFEFGS